MDRAVIDHRSPAFAALVKSLLPDLARVFNTERGRVIVYPTSGTGAWEASLVNVLAPGDAVLAFDYGHFSVGFATAARNLGFAVDLVPLRWGQSVPASAVTEHLRPEHRAVLVVHNETSTGVRSDVRAVREAIDAKRSDALLIVDTVSSLGSMDFRFDEWGVDVALTGSQKGLMLPPGLGFVCASARAIEIASHGGSPRNFFDWRPILQDNAAGFFPYTPATLVLFGLRQALDMLFDEGLGAVFARHHRLAEGVRAAVRGGRRVLGQPYRGGEARGPRLERAHRPRAGSFRPRARRRARKAARTRLPHRSPRRAWRARGPRDGRRRRDGAAGVRSCGHRGRRRGRRGRAVPERAEDRGADLAAEARSPDLSPHTVGEVVDDDLLDHEVFVQVHVAKRRPRLGDLLLAADAVAMKKRDVRPERGAFRAEDGFAEASEVALRIVDDEKEAGVRRDPTRRSRDAEPERRRRRGDLGEPREIDRLVDDRHVRFDGGRLLRIPPMSKLIHTVA
jgi:aspartate aminotransferase-like enzyme